MMLFGLLNYLLPLSVCAKLAALMALLMASPTLNLHSSGLTPQNIKLFLRPEEQRQVMKYSERLC